MVGFASLLPQERAWLRRHSASWMVMMVVKLLGCGGPRDDSLRMDWIWRDLKSYRGMGSILCMNRKLGLDSTRNFFFMHMQASFSAVHKIVVLLTQADLLWPSAVYKLAYFVVEVQSRWVDFSSGLEYHRLFEGVRRNC